MCGVRLYACFLDSLGGVCVCACAESPLARFLGRLALDAVIVFVTTLAPFPRGEIDYILPLSLSLLSGVC